MNLFYLKYFVELAHVRHYTKAAQNLCITQPSLSHAIAQLENELGVPLFEKNGRNTTLTRFGREFLVCAENTLATLDSGVEAARRSAAGEGLIRLGFVRPAGVEYVPRLAREFLEKNSGSDIHFTFDTGPTVTLLDDLKRGRYDVVFCSEPFGETQLTAVPVSNQELVLITPAEHPLANKKSINLDEALEYPMIYFTRESGMRAVVEELFEKTGKSPKIAYETQEDQVIAGLVANGFGIAVVPYMELLHRLGVSIIKIAKPQYSRKIYMVTDSSIYMSPVVEKFCEYVKMY